MDILLGGDSYTFGQGCSDRVFYYDMNTHQQIGDFSLQKNGPSEYCWASLIHKNYSNTNIINLSAPGTNNVSMSLTLLNNMIQDGIVFFNASNVNRLMVQGDIGSTLPQPIVIGNYYGTHSKSYDSALESFAKYLWNENYFVDVSVLSILATYEAAIRNNNKFFWSLPFIRDYRETYAKSIQHLDHIMHLEITSLFGYTFPNNTGQYEGPFISPCRHANNLGHAYYFENHILDILKKEFNNV